MKKTLSLILALLMSASCASFAFADDDTAIADEAVVTSEAAEEVNPTIEFLEAYGIFKGYDDGLPHTEDAVERYQMALFMARVATGWVEDDTWEDGTSNSTEFTDLEGTYAEKVLGALSYVNQKGIIVGYGDGTFGPENTVTYRDALTMAVRTLEYGSGYDYPWDYIEQAVKLGLTNDIEGVAYTDEIDRGVAAQIVYNMLFVATKNGDTLAMRSFDVEFGWQKIIVTADTYGAFAAGEKDTDKGVAFRTFEKDGTLGDTTYYVEDALELGRVYNALFEINADDNYVELLGVVPYEPSTITLNEGITDNEGNIIDNADKIGAYLGIYNVVTKYNTKLLANKTNLDNEIIIADAYGRDSVIKYKDGEESPYAIDWETGDILKKNSNGVYEVEWFYNELLDQYYDYSDVYSAGAGSAIGIELMTEDDVKEIKKNIEETLKYTEEVDSYKLLGGKPGNTAYASLESYDLDADGVDEYAVYEAYRFGKFSTASKKCTEDNFQANDGESDKDNKHDAYVLESVSLPVVGDNNSEYEKIDEVWTIIKDGACPKCDEDEGHFAEGFEPSEGFTGYVIYGVNPSTKEIKIVKEIGAYGKSEDADSYYSTGIVRGNSESGKTVTIDNTKISYDYSSLRGTPFVKVEDFRGIYSDLFDGLFQQFVDYVVVDNKLVYVAAKGEISDNYIVVEDYYGIDSDGYIVVEGYKTDALGYRTFRIGAIDGWATGSAFWYDVIENEFDRGAVLKVTSCDASAENGAVYNVTCLGTPGDYYEDATFALEDVTIKIEDGRRVITWYENGEKKEETKKVADSDRYVIIANGKDASQANKFMPIYVKNGKAANKSQVTGDLLVKKDGSYIIVNADWTTIKGFGADTVKTGYVAIVDKKVTERTFDGFGDDDNYYILGASKYTVKAVDLLSANGDIVEVDVTATNIDVKESKIYRTIDNVIVNDNVLTFAEFKTDVKEAYTYDYKFLNFKFDLANDFEKKNVSKDEISKNFYNFENKDGYDDLINDYKVRLVELDSNGYVKDIKKVGSAADVTDVKGATTIDAFLIYDNKTADEGDVVVYIVKGDDVATENKDTKTVSSDYVIELPNSENAYVVASAKVDYTKEVTYDEDGKKVTSTTATVKSLTFTVDGKATTDTHANVLEKGLHYGIKDYCDLEKWNATVNGTPVYGTLVAETYAPHAEGDDCDIIKAITLNTEVKVEGDTIITVYVESNTENATNNDTYIVHAWIEDGELKFDFMADNVHKFIKAADMVK